MLWLLVFLITYFQNFLWNVSICPINFCPKYIFYSKMYELFTAFHRKFSNMISGSQKAENYFQVCHSGSPSMVLLLPSNLFLIIHQSVFATTNKCHIKVRLIQNYLSCQYWIWKIHHWERVLRQQIWENNCKFPNLIF